jgi:hypothetical protein
VPYRFHVSHAVCSNSVFWLCVTICVGSCLLRFLYLRGLLRVLASSSTADDAYGSSTLDILYAFVPPFSAPALPAVFYFYFLRSLPLLSYLAELFVFMAL